MAISFSPGINESAGHLVIVKGPVIVTQTPEPWWWFYHRIASGGGLEKLTINGFFAFAVFLDIARLIGCAVRSVWC